MRICLIGTSNSIYKDGYAGALARDPRVTRFDKYSLGASPSIIIPFFSRGIDFSNYDWAIFETAINDRNYYKYGSIRKDQIREFVECGVRLANLKGCKSALLLMPSRKAFGKETISGVIYGKIAKESGIPLFNGFECIERLSSGRAIGVNDCFIDDFHVEKDLAFEMGREFCSLLVKSIDTKVKVKESNFIYGVTDLSIYSGAVVARRTSIASQDFAILDSGESLKIKLPMNTEVIGVAYNASRTHGSVQIDGEVRLVKK